MTSSSRTTEGPIRFIHHYASQHCDNYQCYNNNNDTLSYHLSQDHFNDILNNIVRPAFSQHQHPALDTMRYKYYDPTKDSDYLENQPWKENTHGYDQAHVVEWIVDACPLSKLSHYLPQLIPPMLLIMDDYDVNYKIRGVDILHKIVQKVPDDDHDTITALTHVDSVFIATLFNCLTYISDESHLPLVKASYPCMMDLISKTKPLGSQQRAKLYEKIIVDGIIMGLKLGRYTISLRQILFGQLSRIYAEMGVLGVQYLKVILAALMEALTVPSLQLNKAALEALQTIIQICWPRIPGYRTMLLKGLAVSWQFYYTKEKAVGDEMRQLLKETVRLYRLACKGTENADIDALLEFNPSIYSPLLLIDSTSSTASS
ncbi:hypothetical protein BDA99DRAFT_530624 [Phascolomyces articulosus]|uniref:Uncharacterized protein n=1 Tax=Phascolomyces articulosus TaxID=60185 RepID=A0AAD5JWP7_9FUNG|nr:hypothetical protein BDA99DRAFT_530624 [Phascolomyces articulosus]